MPGCFAVVHRARCRRTPGLAAGRLGRASLTAGGQPIKPDREDFPACRADAPGNCRWHAIRCSKNIMHCGAFNPLTARTEVTAVLPAQEEILAERMAALTAADIPPGDDARWDDGTGRPAELAALDGNGWEELLAAAVPVITGLRDEPSWPADPPDPAGDAFPAVRAPRPFGRRGDRVRGRGAAGCAGGRAGTFLLETKHYNFIFATCCTVFMRSTEILSLRGIWFLLPSDTMSTVSVRSEYIVRCIWVIGGGLYRCAMQDHF